MTRNLAQLLLAPRISNLSAAQIRRIELVASLSIASALFSLFSVVLFPFEQSVAAVQLIRLNGIVASVLAYFLSRYGWPGVANWIVILGAIVGPTYGTVYFDGQPESILYIHLGAIIAFYTMSAKEATAVAGLAIMLIISTFLFHDNREMGFANFALALAVFISLRIGSLHRERQLSQIQEQAGQLVALEKSRQEMMRQQQQTAFLKQVMTNLGHDIKTPLSVINLQALVVEQQCEQPRTAARMKKISQAVNQIDLVVNKLSQLNQANEAAAIPLQTLDINRVIWEAKDNWRPGPRQQLDFHLASTPLFIRANDGALRLALTTLVENAFIHTTPDVQVSIATGIKDDRVVVSLTDTGPGIAKQDQKAIFEFSYKVDKSRNGAEAGPGLGLPIAKQIIENHGGDIRVHSDIGRGTQVTIRLPRVRQELVPVPQI